MQSDKLKLLKLLWGVTNNLLLSCVGLRQGLISLWFGKYPTDGWSQDQDCNFVLCESIS